MNHRCTDYIGIEGEEVEDVQSFVYLGSVLDKLGGTEADIKRRLAQARIAFTRLQNIWRSGKFSPAEDQAAHPELKRAFRATVWS